MSSLHILLKSIVEDRHTLSRAEARALLTELLLEPAAATEIELAALLTAMAMRGETAAELTGFAEAMRAAATPLPLTNAEREALVDTCGTGGDGHGTFNISTGAALVAAGAGARIAKHGNRAVTSRCGSADVLEALGVPIDLPPAEAVACFRSTGFMFLLATSLHPAMRRLAPVRRALGFRTIFNLAGPLTNPAGARAQVMGVWARSKMELVAQAMQQLGVRHAMVVYGEGLDELTVTGTSQIATVRQPVGGAGSAAEIAYTQLAPSELGLPLAPLSALGGGGSAEQSAAVLLAILEGRERGPRRDVVALNAAAALVAGGVATNLSEALLRATDALDCGAAMSVLERLRAMRPDGARR